jgi:hypothetical protein
MGKAQVEIPAGKSAWREGKEKASRMSISEIRVQQYLDQR